MNTQQCGVERTIITMDQEWTEGIYDVHCSVTVGRGGSGNGQVLTTLLSSSHDIHLDLMFMIKICAQLCFSLHKHFNPALPKLL